MATKIVFNGQEYPSVEAMPPAVRQAYQQVMGMFADKDGDGVPDLFQDGGIEPTVIQQSSFVMNGQAYPSLEAMPPDVRRMYEQAMGQMGQAPMPAPASPAESAPSPPRMRGGTDVPRWGEEERSRNWLPWTLVFALLGILAWVLLR
jgi:hypothetical protein